MNIWNYRKMKYNLTTSGEQRTVKVQYSIRILSIYVF